MAITYPYTVDELYDNYEFKIIKRAIMREFPWIKNIGVSQESLDTYNLIFMNFDIDPVELGEQYGWTLTPWVAKAIEMGKQYKAMYLSQLFDEVTYESGKELIKDILKIVHQIHKSPALPEELKIKGGRNLDIGDFMVNRGEDPWY